MRMPSVYTKVMLVYSSNTLSISLIHLLPIPARSRQPLTLPHPSPDSRLPSRLKVRHIQPSHRLKQHIHPPIPSTTSPTTKIERINFALSTHDLLTPSQERLAVLVKEVGDQEAAACESVAGPVQEEDELAEVRGWRGGRNGEAEDCGGGEGEVSVPVHGVQGLISKFGGGRYGGR